MQVKNPNSETNYDSVMEKENNKIDMNIRIPIKKISKKNDFYISMTCSYKRDVGNCTEKIKSQLGNEYFWFLKILKITQN